MRTETAPIAPEMLKASSLYLVIMIALVISLICSALIMSAYFYSGQYQQKFRYDRLEHNLNSGISLLLSAAPVPDSRNVDLFGDGEDSVSFKKISWGVFDIGACRAFKQHDTLYRIFSIARAIDSAKWAALYVIDEDRPVSVSGKTGIHGNAYLPKAGIRPAYVDNKAYQGNDKIVSGHIYNSEKKLPVLNEDRLQVLEKQFSPTEARNTELPDNDSLDRSFFEETTSIHLGKKTIPLTGISLKGNIILYADTTLIIDSTVHLSGVLIFAPGVIFKNGFRGDCQVFARDSIQIGARCHFNYPSCLGVLRFGAEKVRQPLSLSVGENAEINGMLFTYERKPGEIRPFIRIAQDAEVLGIVYSQGILSLKDGVRLNGAVLTSRLFYQTSFTAYENYLINVVIDQSRLSPHTLASPLFPVASKSQKILQWLASN
jgi:hypothetical protein